MANIQSLTAEIFAEAAGSKRETIVHDARDNTDQQSDIERKGLAFSHVLDDLLPVTSQGEVMEKINVDKDSRQETSDEEEDDTKLLLTAEQLANVVGTNQALVENKDTMSIVPEMGTLSTTINIVQEKSLNLAEQVEVDSNKQIEEVTGVDLIQDMTIAAKTDITDTPGITELPSQDTLVSEMITVEPQTSPELLAMTQPIVTENAAADLLTPLQSSVNQMSMFTVPIPMSDENVEQPDDIQIVPTDVLTTMHMSKPMIKSDPTQIVEAQPEIAESGSIILQPPDLDPQVVSFAQAEIAVNAEVDISTDGESSSNEIKSENPEMVSATVANDSKNVRLEKTAARFDKRNSFVNDEYGVKAESNVNDISEQVEREANISTGKIEIFQTIGAQHASMIDKASNYKQGSILVTDASLYSGNDFGEIYSSNLNINNPDWADGIGQRMFWMLDGGIKNVAIHIEPPELGPLSIQLRAFDNKTNVTFTSHSHEVKGIIENATPRLHRLFDEQGIGLGQVQLNVSSHQFSGNNSGFEHQSSQTKSSAFNGTTATTSLLDSQTQVGRSISLRGLIDYYV